MGVSGMAGEPTQENNRWDKIQGFFLDNSPLALTLAYLYVTAIGMLYSAELYGRFGINIFDYSEIVDFILAAFKNPIAIILGVLQGASLALAAYVVPLVVQWLRAKRMTLELVRWLRAKRMISEPEQGETFSVRAYRRNVLMVGVPFTALGILLFTYSVAGATAYSIESGDEQKVEVRYRSFSDSAGQVTTPGLQFIGATQRAVFFYDADHKHTIVIPQSQLVSIEVPHPD